MEKLKPGVLLPGEEMRDVMLEHLMLCEVITNSDLTEGRGQRVSLGWFLHQLDAQERARGAGVLGTDAIIERSEQWVLRYKACTVHGSREVIHIVGTEVIVHYVDPEVLRQRALAKLTPEEIKLLGLSHK